MKTLCENERLQPASKKMRIDEFCLIDSEVEIDSEYDEDKSDEKDEEDGVEEAKGQSKQQFWEPGIAYDVDSWVNNATPDIQEEFLESALVNAWILYKISRELAFLEVEYTHLQFRVAVSLALAQEWEDMGCVFNPNTACGRISRNNKYQWCFSRTGSAKKKTCAKARFVTKKVLMHHMNRL